MHKNWKIDPKRIEKIEEYLANSEAIVYPSKENRYRAFKMAPEDIKVVILGQDKQNHLLINFYSEYVQL